MAKKQAKNQLPLDFTARGDRMVYCIGDSRNQLSCTRIFEELLSADWLPEPSGDYCEVSSADEIVRHIGYKLPYPEVIKIARLQNAEADFSGFAAVYKQQGWAVIPDSLDANERNFAGYLLTLVLGLYQTYTQKESLEARALAILSETLLPQKEVSTFFHTEVTKISPALALDIADYFKVPFGVVLQRARDLGIISESQYEGFLSIKPEQSGKQRELYVTGEDNMDDLESYLFGEEGER